MHDLVARWNRLKDHLSFDFLGGPRPVPLAWVINVQKGGTLPFVLFLMYVYDVWSPAAWAYLALHGSYGLCWLLKEAIFPDPGWRRPATIGGAVLSWLMVLGPYWLIPWLLISNDVQASPLLITFATTLYVLGLATMMGADTQKFFVLKARRGLITDGWFSRVRHPNYLGEITIYASFAVLAQHPLAWAILILVWTTVFLPNMLAKEASMARYPEWAAYKARTGFLLPRLLPARAPESAPAEPAPSR